MSNLAVTLLQRFYIHCLPVRISSETVSPQTKKYISANQSKFIFTLLNLIEKTYGILKWTWKISSPKIVKKICFYTIKSYFNHISAHVKCFLIIALSYFNNIEFPCCWQVWYQKQQVWQVWIQLRRKWKRMLEIFKGNSFL